MMNGKAWAAAVPGVLGALIMLCGCRGETEYGGTLGISDRDSGIGSQKGTATLGLSGIDPAADNSWAMFLVNAKNPIERDYSEGIGGIGLSVVYESWRSYSMDCRAAEYMIQMIDDARNDGIELIVMSAYRSFDRQEEDFNYVVKENMDIGMTEEEARAAALSVVQRPGCSEHNAGICADILSSEYTNMDDDGFKDTEAFAWLRENAPKYGFILRYPEDGYEKTDISFEPWHYRFVGKYYAQLLTDRGITLEEYFEEMEWVDEEGKLINN